MTDDHAPAAALGWHSPAAGLLSLEVSATDVGTGLAATQALVDGRPVSSATFGGAKCADLSPSADQADLPLDEDCPAVKATSMDVDTTALADGSHTLVVRVLDAAGNETDEVHTLVVANHVDLGSATQKLSVGTTVGGSPGAPGGGEGGFRGTLTCILHDRRTAAPKRTRIDFLNQVGKRTLDKGGALVRSKGRVTFIVTALSTRTLIFRFLDANGRRVDVKIKVTVARR